MTSSATTLATTIATTINKPYVLASVFASGVKISSEFLGDITASQLKIVYFISFFLINGISVSLPGRLDGELAKEIQDEKKNKQKNKQKTKLTASPISITGGRTLVAPAPWAFAIWGPIYITEFLLVLLITISPPTSPLLKTFLPTAPYWFLASLSQSLWCLSFRSTYVKSSNPFYNLSSPIYLTLTSLFLLKIHAMLTKLAVPWYTHLPITLHAGWTLCASIVNVNGSLAYSGFSNKVLRVVGHGSVIAAVSAAWTVARMGGGGGIAGVVTWALTAVGGGMKERIKNGEGNMEGAKTQEIISYAGAVATAGIAVWGGGKQNSGGGWGNKVGEGMQLF
ncbi:hypothetical protein TrCOL_g1081 [Triparma columacea]|uniref:Uncharacterized protein n=1 Tax=Triparma columacea TaxID=722753 RepID=A0A9W7G1U5_9STRA|nr:hypothetical protein TrCOL_g1081 [Triparma columacea]